MDCGSGLAGLGCRFHVYGLPILWNILSLIGICRRIGLLPVLVFEQLPVGGHSSMDFAEPTHRNLMEARGYRFVFALDTQLVSMHRGDGQYSICIPPTAI